MSSDAPERPLRVLVVATKPPWPAVGGGSLTLHGLLVGLCRRGARVTVVSLGSDAEPRPELPYQLCTTGTSPRSWLNPANVTRFPWPLLMARYQVSSLRAAVARAVATFQPDAVHLEQLHTAWLLPWLRRRCCVILREQNVEHLLVARVSQAVAQPWRAILRFERRLLVRVEARSCVLADAVAAISDVDAAVLRRLAPAAHVLTLPAAFLQSRTAPKIQLEGSPPFLALGSFDWRANRTGALWLIRDVWPTLRRLVPGSVLHVAGPGSRSLPGTVLDGVVLHGPVPDASALFDPRAIVLIPVRAGSGVRMRLLEAWNEFVPAVTTPLGGEGLVSGDGDGALLAATPAEFARAAARLAADAAQRRNVTEIGQRRILDHAPDTIADLALEHYRDAIARRGAERPRQR